MQSRFIVNKNWSNVVITASISIAMEQYNFMLFLLM